MIIFLSESLTCYKKDNTISSTEILEKLQICAQEREWKIHIRKDPLKRLFDIVFSFTFLVAATPLFIALSVLIGLTSNGPVFYKSRRMGRGGKTIQCWKFRSMYKDAEVRLHDLLLADVQFKTEWDAFQKVKHDPRITPVGKFLRKTSLDEIPQFWNVLKGELSVVGPRPPTLVGPEENNRQEIRILYGDKAEKILSVRPGITGVWQVSGRSQITFEERCSIEENYALHHTFWQDLVVIAKTIPAVLFAKGAF